MSEPTLPVAAVGAAAKFGATTLAEKQKDNSRVNAALLEKAKDTPVFGTAVKAYGKRQAMKQVILTGLFEGLIRRLNLGAEYLQEEFYEDMAARTANIPDEDLQAPIPSVAMPAIQGLGFSSDEPDLKELYLGLLTTASDSRVAPSAHPSFAEFIKQLSATEAAYLGLVLRSNGLPIMRLTLVEREPEEGGYFVVKNHVLPWSDDDGESEVPPYGATWVDNWVRLGLIIVDYKVWLEGDETYAWCERRPEYELAKSMYQSENKKLAYDKGLLRVTDLGAQFAEAVGIRKT